MKFKTRILEHFGVAPGEYRGAAFRKYADALREAMRDDLFAVLIGEKGCGKKTVVGSVLREVLEAQERGDLRRRLIYIKINDDTRITIRQIATIMVEELSLEGVKPRRDYYALKKQLASLLGALTQGREPVKVTVVIEQAQHLLPQTIRALKELREINFLDTIEMFGVILSGHPALLGRIQNMEDVFPRVDVERMDEARGWMDRESRIEYLKARWGRLLNIAMREQIVDYMKTPMLMDHAVYEAMKGAYEVGKNALDELDFIFDLKAEVERNRLSYQEIADRMGVSKATVGQVINRKYDGDPHKYVEVQQTVTRLIQEKRREAI